MADLEPVQPSLCQRICCCMTTSVKEPPVQLIRSGALDVTPMTNGHISAAENTIDGFEDINLEQRTIPNITATIAGASADRSKPRVVVEKEQSAVNMNDIIMADILGDDNHDEVEAVVEDAVSISTNVVEEVDEMELSRLRLHPSCDLLLPAKPNDTKEIPSEPSEDEDDHVFHDGHSENGAHDLDNDPEHSDHDDRVVIHDVQVVASKGEHSPSLQMPSTSKEKEEKVDSPRSEDEESATVETTRNDDFSESEEEVESERSTPILNRSLEITEVPQNQRDLAGPSVIQVVPKEDVESGTEEEIILATDVTPTVQKSFNPPSLPATKSIMYADTSSSDEDSDEEAAREVMQPVQRSQRIMNIDQLRTDQLTNGHAGSDSTLDGTGRKSLDSSSSSDDELIRERKTSKENNGGAAVTRIVVRDNGLPDVLSSGGVKLNVEAVTDEEFSEKLI